MEKKMETTQMGHTQTPMSIHSFIPSYQSKYTAGLKELPRDFGRLFEATYTMTMHETLNHNIGNPTAGFGAWGPFDILAGLNSY